MKRPEPQAPATAHNDMTPSVGTPDLSPQLAAEGRVDLSANIVSSKPTYASVASSSAPSSQQPRPVTAGKGVDLLRK
jgi:hypothetical protein